MLYPVSKAGRVANEWSSDRGSVIHLVQLDSEPRYRYGYLDNGWKPALCKSVPGKRRGNGWTYAFGSQITCQKCLRLAEKTGVAIAS